MQGAQRVIGALMGATDSSKTPPSASSEDSLTEGATRALDIGYRPPISSHSAVLSPRGPEQRPGPTVYVVRGASVPLKAASELSIRAQSQKLE